MTLNTEQRYRDLDAENIMCRRVNEALREQVQGLFAKINLLEFGIKQLVRLNSGTKQGKLATHILAECEIDCAGLDPEDSKYRFWCSLLTNTVRDVEKRWAPPKCEDCGSYQRCDDHYTPCSDDLYYCDECD